MVRTAPAASSPPLAAASSRARGGIVSRPRRRLLFGWPVAGYSYRDAANREDDMSDGPWGVGDNAPMNEGSETTAVGGGSIGERKAGEATVQGIRTSGEDKLPWGASPERPGAIGGGAGR
jgi:hypothetical protein